MSVKKALALLCLLAIAIFAGLVIINQFYPNPYTAGIYAFITVTVPAYLSDKLEWVFGSVSAVMAVIGAASKKIGSVRDEASKQVEDAELEANKAKTVATNQIGTVQDLQDENERLTNELTGIKQTRTETEQLFSQQQNTIKAQEKQIADLREDLRLLKVQTATVEVVK